MVEHGRTPQGQEQRTNQQKENAQDPAFNKQTSRIYYSQPALTRTAESIKKTADEVIAENPLTIKKNGELYIYDKNGWPITIKDANTTLTRRYDNHGFIKYERLEKQEKDNSITVEERTLSYLIQNRIMKASTLKYTAYELRGEKRTHIEGPSVIDFSDVPSFLPLQASKRTKF